MTPHRSKDSSPRVGFFTGTLPIPADLPTDCYYLRLELTDDRGRVYPFEQICDLYL